MKRGLANIDGVRTRFRATVERYGSKANRWGSKQTLHLRSIVRATDSLEVADHVWFTVGNWCAGLTEGCEIEFDARVGDYIKGYVNHRHGIDDRTRDWKLNRPTNVVVLKSNRAEQPSLLADGESA